MHQALFEPASFRDGDNRVICRADGVYRGLSEAGLDDFQALASSVCFARWVAKGMLVRTRVVDAPNFDVGQPQAGGVADWVAWLEHERLPLVSYPFEWSFEMLRNAALLHLEMLQTALREDLILKDGSAYNVQFVGCRPRFIDVGSFTRYAAGGAWEGYEQFCQHFLFPLMLASYKGVPFQPWLRGQLSGIEADWLRRLLSPRDLLRPGVLTHVVLQSLLQSRAASQRDVRPDLQEAGFHRGLIENNVRRMARLIRRLPAPRQRSPWADYENASHYSEADRRRKREFVATAAAARRWSLVWDLGCNLGEYSTIAAEHADYVVAMDADPVVVDRLFGRLKQKGPRNVLPLVWNMADQTSGVGWRGHERRGLADRGRPELTLCLGLLHHLVLSAGLPLSEIVDWLAELGSDLVIEFVDPQDPMAASLGRTRLVAKTDYQRAEFERLLNDRFDVVDQCELGCRTRTLYFARRA